MRAVRFIGSVLDHGAAAEVENLLYQVGRLVGLVHDGLKLLRHRGWQVTLAHRQLGIENDGREQIAEIVRNTGGQLADSGQLFLASQLLLHLLALGDVTGHDDGIRVLFKFNRLDGHLSWKRLSILFLQHRGNSLGAILHRLFVRRETTNLLPRHRRNQIVNGRCEQPFARGPQMPAGGFVHVNQTTRRHLKQKDRVVGLIQQCPEPLQLCEALLELRVVALLGGALAQTDDFFA